METIAQETVAAAWDRMCELSEAQSLKLAERMQKEQPFLLVFLLAGEQGTPEPDRGWLLELGAFVWSLMNQERGKACRTVTSENLEQALALNARSLERFNVGNVADLRRTACWLALDYPQAPLLDALAELLISVDEDVPALGSEELSTGFRYLKTVIDCLDR